MNEWLEKLQQMVFPDICLVCHSTQTAGSPIPGLCRACLSRLPWRTGARALAWPAELAADWPAGLKPAQTLALRASVASSRILVACDYQTPVREGLIALKFADASEWYHTLAGILLQTVRLEMPGTVSAVVAVPLHASRLAERGYNQSALLAKSLARSLQLPDWSPWLVRTRRTSRQSAQTERAARFANLAGAFRWQGPANLQAAHILLVDDVLTTGATLGAAARPLFLAGARVTGLVVASNHRENAGC
jgi:ComF family protein